MLVGKNTMTTSFPMTRGPSRTLSCWLWPKNGKQLRPVMTRAVTRTLTKTRTKTPQRSKNQRGRSQNRSRTIRKMNQLCQTRYSGNLKTTLMQILICHLLSLRKKMVANWSLLLRVAEEALWITVWTEGRQRRLQISLQWRRTLMQIRIFPPPPQSRQMMRKQEDQISCAEDRRRWKN